MDAEDQRWIFPMIIIARINYSVAKLLKRIPTGIQFIKIHDESSQRRVDDQIHLLIQGYYKSDANDINAHFCVDIINPIFDFTKEQYGSFKSKEVVIKAYDPFCITPDTSDVEEEEMNVDVCVKSVDYVSVSSVDDELLPDRPRPKPHRLNR